MDKFVRVSDVVDWFRAYGHMDQEIPFETLVTDLRDNSIPAADVAPVVHGSWVEDMSKTIPTAKCSVCEKGFQAYYKDYQYCPRCGAKMLKE